MLNIYKYEGKQKEECLEKCLEELKCTQDELFLKSEFIEGKLFKGAKYIVSVVKKKDIAIFIKEYIKDYAKLINIDIDMEILIKEETFNVTLVSEKNSILIGKEGKTLNSLQLVIKQAIKKEIDLNVRINLDASNYKLKKLKNIERQINQLAKEIQNTKIDVSLDPMNSYERRLVHSIINEYSNLETESIGEGMERHVIIKYVENKKVSN